MWGKKKIKILYISSYLDVGGVEVLLLNFLKKIDREKYAPSVCVFCENGKLTAEFEAIDVPIHIIKKKSGFDLRLPFRLIKLIKDEEIDIAHTHNSAPWLYAGIAKMFLSNLRLIHTKHSNLESNRKLLLKAEKLLSLITDCVIAVAGDVAEFMVQKQRISERKIKLIHNGIDVEKFAIPDGAKPKNNKDKIVGIVARLAPVKNHKNLLDAFKIINGRFACARLWIIGTGPLENELKDYSARTGISEKVDFLGERRDVADLMRSMDVFVLCSLSEGMSITLIEAMASGLPIAATAVGGTPEIVVDAKTGILVPSEDPRALADAVCRLLCDDSLALAMGRSGKERVIENYSMEKMISEYCRVYENVLAGKTRVLVVGELPPPVGGMGKQAELLIKNLKKDGYAVRVIKSNAVFIKCFSWLDRIKIIKSMARFILFVSKLSVNLAFVEIIHIFSNSYLNFILFTAPVVFFGKLFRKRVIINYHGGAAEGFLGKYLFLARGIFKMADAIIVPSGYLKDVFARFGLGAEVVANMLDLENFHYYKDRKPSAVFITARHLEKTYNTECVLRAFSVIRKKYPEARLDIAGDGTQRRKLEDMSKELGLNGSAVFRGALNNDEIARLHDGASFFLNASLVDNMPVAIIEAFASGVAVVSSRAGGIPYIVENNINGILVDLDNHEQMAEKVFTLLEDKELFNRVRENAYDKINDYSWKSVKEKLLEVYGI